MSNVSEYIDQFMQFMWPIPEIIIWSYDNRMSFAVIVFFAIFVYINFSKIVRYFKYNIF